jgi:hypothetical protein
MKEKKRKNKYSKYCNFIGEQPYQFSHVKPIFDRLGGIMTTIQGQHLIRGLIVFMTQPTMLPDPEISRVYIGHGTSNKGLKMFWKDPGRYDFFMTTGPKMSAAFAMHNWGLYPEKNDIHVGPVKSDAWVNGTFDIKKARKLVGTPDGKPIALLAPTWNRNTVQNYTDRLRPLESKFHVVLKPHPNEIVDKRADWVTLYMGELDDILYAADLLFTDESSVGYEFLPTGKPIVVLRNKQEGGFEDPHEYQLKYSTANWAPYKGQQLDDAVSEALDRVGELHELCKRVFWPIDGHCAERACNWMVDQIERRWL